MKVDNAIAAIQNQSKVSKQFSLKELVEQNIQGSSGEFCHIDFTAYDLAPTDVLAKANFEQEISGSVCGSLVTRLTDRMMTKGFVKLAQDEAGTVVNTVSGGMTPRAVTRKVCHNNSFAGISYDSGCSDENYTVLDWNDGFSSKDLYLNDQSHYEETQSANLNSVVPRWNTMSFQFI